MTRVFDAKKTFSFKFRFLVFVSVGLGINVFMTQHIARALGLTLPFYKPFTWISLYFSYYYYIPDVFIETFAIISIVMLVMLLFGGFFYVHHHRSARSIDDLHGSARFATIKDIKKAGLIAKSNGVYVGGFCHKNFKYYLKSTGPEPVMVFAPTRSGKGVGLVIPTLLHWNQSILCFDLKGENYNLTAGYKNQEGYKVLKFAPAQLDNTCYYNCLNQIRLGTEYEIADAQDLATIIVDPEGKGLDTHDGHWRKTARSLIAGILLYVLYDDPDASLSTVAYFLSSDEEEMIEHMIHNSFDHGDPHRFIASSGQELKNKPGRERGSVISTATALFDLYKDPIVSENTSYSSFDIDDLMDHESPIALYIVIEPKDLIRLTPLCRIFFTNIINTLTRQQRFLDGEVVHRRHRVLLLWDEFASIGRLELFEKQIAYMAGYGFKVYLIIQDIAQLWDKYGENENITSNCLVKIAYTPNKLKTAELISKMTGETTVVKKQTSRSGGLYSVVLNRVSVSTHETKRPLMTVDEVLQLKGPQKNKDGKILEAGNMLIFVTGHPVILGTQILYFEDSSLKEKTLISPPIVSHTLKRRGDVI